MATVVLLSSSPPRTFARSPTAADESSPLPSPQAVLRDARAGPPQFKSSDRTRDRFSGGFNTAGSMLKPKPGAENIPLGSPGRGRFKHKSLQSQDMPRDKHCPHEAILRALDVPSREEPPEHLGIPSIPGENVAAIPEAFSGDQFSNLRQATTDEGISGVSACDIVEVASSPVPMEKAVPRRSDWTPVKVTDPGCYVDASGGFSKDLMHSFTFNGCVKEATTVSDHDDKGPTERRRIDMVSSTVTHEPVSIPGIHVADKGPQERPGPKKRNKSPAKKTLTITHLATTHYGEQHLNQGKNTPMLEYLTASQICASGTALARAAPARVAKPKTLPKKSRATKKGPAKSRLVSPTSAMKTLNDQDMIFGSVSQLAREESPSLIRDTIEATRRSELFLSSDPISPQRTQPVSIEATSPQAHQGTRRYVKRRNLWGAAGRDEDNALLHVDSIDLSDSPAVRLALAGKDVLLQPDSATWEKSRNTILVPGWPQKTPLTVKGSLLVDIDEFFTPTLPRLKSPTRSQARGYHASTSLEAPRSSQPDKHEGENVTSKGKTPKSKPKSAPTKPAFAGFTDHALQKQISSYGFKPVKKREKMIELLERCWEDKYGDQPGGDPDEEAVLDKSAESMTHADFLGKVHDVAARPMPKVKKPRGKRKSESDGATTTREPKKRKQAEAKPKTPKEKTARKPAATKRKGKIPALSEESVLDIDDIDDSHAENAMLPTHEDEFKSMIAEPTNAAKICLQSRAPATPPPTIPQAVSVSAVPDIAARPPAAEASTLALERVDVGETTLTPTQTPPLPDLQSQIRTAIMFKSTSTFSQHSATGKSPARKSAKPKSASTSSGARTGKSSSTPRIHPTWREKILMYDPVVLEDLTAWLNTEGFRMIGEDREVSALEVRTWCEANGVCCYGIGGGWRGTKGRK